MPSPRSSSSASAPATARLPRESDVRMFKAAVVAVVVLMTVSFLVVETSLTITSNSLRNADSFYISGAAATSVNDSAVADDEFATLLRLGDTVTGPVFDERIYQVDWSRHVHRADVLHMGQLERVCMDNKDSVILWNYTTENAATTVFHKPADGDELAKTRVLQALRQCADVDVYVPMLIRNSGYCEDASAYIKYLHGRILPRWAIEMQFFDESVSRTVKYHELCPRTPMILFNHYWDGVRDDAAWPATKPLYLMPNIEMYELEAKHYAQADVVLCKTVICTQYVRAWFKQEGNPKMTEVLYTRFTTSDVAMDALLVAGIQNATSDWVDRHKDFQNPVFLHAAGTSMQKGTRAVLECWLDRPDLPELDLYIAEDTFEGWYKDFRKRIDRSKNVKLHLGKLDATSFGRVIADAAFFLCTSIMEGYGHYVNQARASGGVVVTPDVPPMNELVSSSSGILVAATRITHVQQFLGGKSTQSQALRGVEGFVALFGGKEVCAAVDRLLKHVTTEKRRQLAARVWQQYLYDTAFFAMKMEELRSRLRPS